MNYSKFITEYISNEDNIDKVESICQIICCEGAKITDLKRRVTVHGESLTDIFINTVGEVANNNMSFYRFIAPIKKRKPIIDNLRSKEYFIIDEKILGTRFILLGTTSELLDGGCDMCHVDGTVAIYSNVQDMSIMPIQSFIITRVVVVIMITCGEFMGMHLEDSMSHKTKHQLMYSLAILIVTSLMDGKPYHFTIQLLIKLFGSGTIVDTLQDISDRGLLKDEDNEGSNI